MKICCCLCLCLLVGIAERRAGEAQPMSWPWTVLPGNSTQWTSQGGDSSPSEWVVTWVHQEASSPKASPWACQEA